LERYTGHQHLVCRGCGKVIDFESHLLDKLREKIHRDHDFNVTKTELYMEGYCQQCNKEPGDRAGVSEVSKMPLDQGIE